MDNTWREACYREKPQVQCTSPDIVLPVCWVESRSLLFTQLTVEQTAVTWRCAQTACYCLQELLRERSACVCMQMVCPISWAASTLPPQSAVAPPKGSTGNRVSLLSAPCEWNIMYSRVNCVMEPNNHLQFAFCFSLCLQNVMKNSEFICYTSNQASATALPVVCDVTSTLGKPPRVMSF